MSQTEATRQRSTNSARCCRCGADPRPIRARNQPWLAAALEQIWEDHFWDVPRPAPIAIRFGARWKSRLGLIRWDEASGSTLIALNACFRDPAVPAFICRITLAHEIVHYAHGYGSPLPRRLADPHADDIVERELTSRGLAAELHQTAAWIDQHWETVHEPTSRRLSAIH